MGVGVVNPPGTRGVEVDGTRLRLPNRFLDVISSDGSINRAITGQQLDITVGAGSGTVDCDATVAFGDPVYWNDANSQFELGDATAISTADIRGIVVNKISISECVISNYVKITGLAGLTSGARYFLKVGGGIDTVVPSSSGNVVKFLGQAISTTVLIFETSYIPMIRS